MGDTANLNLTVVIGTPGVCGDKKVSAEYRHVTARDTWPRTDISTDITTLYDLWTHSVAKFSKKKCLGWRDPTQGDEAPFQWLSYEAANIRVEAVGSALAAAGMKPHSRIGILGANCPEWMIAMQACNRQGLYCVPLYDSLGENAIEYILQHSEASAVFVEASKLQRVAAALPHVKGQVKVVVWWGADDAAAVKTIQELGIRVLPWSAFVEAGQQAPLPASPPKPDEYCTIMYTSGTTGDPKGVLIKHSAVLATAIGTVEHINSVKSTVGGRTLDSDDRILSYLPLAHIFDRVAEETHLLTGASIGYWRGDIKGLMNDIAMLKPTVFIGVPRVFDRIYSTVTAKTKAAGGIKAALFNFGFARKLRHINEGWKQDQASPFFDKIVFAKVKAALGGNVRLILTGGAPLARHVEDFLKVTMCCPVVQGYGLTESCAASFIGIPDQQNQTGTVGPPMPCLGMRLESCPELNYDAHGSPPCGEVCLRGPPLFSGYYKQPEMTKEVMDSEGWFHTGDIGTITEAGALKIIDRKKNIFKLSQGEYIAVEAVEAVFKKNPAFEQLWVYGNSFESCLVAVIVPTEDALKSWAASANLEARDRRSICKDPKTREWLLSEITRTGKEGKLKGFQLVKAVYVESEQWTVEDELMTPSFKLKRPQLQKKYQDEIDIMYKSVGGGHQQR